MSLSLNCSQFRYNRSQKGFLPFTGYIVLGLGATVLILSIALKVQSARLEAAKDKYDAFVAQVEAEGKIAKAKSEAEIKRQKEVTQRANQDHARKLAALRADYDRLRDSGSRGGSMPPVPSTARSPDAEARDQQLLGILQHAEEQTLRLMELQEWVREQAR